MEGVGQGCYPDGVAHATGNRAETMVGVGEPTSSAGLWLCLQPEPPHPQTLRTLLSPGGTEGALVLTLGQGGGACGSMGSVREYLVFGGSAGVTRRWPALGPGACPHSVFVPMPRAGLALPSPGHCQVREKGEEGRAQICREGGFCWRPELPPKPALASSTFLLAVPPSCSYLPISSLPVFTGSQPCGW